ncbi:MAG TPA: rubrerythrin family protein [Desulfobulbus sp.]|nr:rubrerythrin family protein [Desulfobulbus sp.]
MDEKILLLIARLYRQASRSTMYALRADKDKRPELAVFFQALAESHSRQAQRFLVQARGHISDTGENAKTAAEEELPTFIETFDALHQEALDQNNKTVATGCKHSAGIERMNRNLIQRLIDDPEVRSYHVCDFCGFLSPDAPPDSCPICTAPKKRFIEIAP